METFLSEGRIAEARLDFETARAMYLDAIEQNSNLGEAHCRLAAIYQMNREVTKAREHAREAVSMQTFDDECLLIASGSVVDSLSPGLAIKSQPGGLLIQAERLVADKEYAFAIDLLKNFLEDHHGHLHAQAMLGESLARTRSIEFSIWNRSLPKLAEKDPAIWYARGVAALTSEDNDLARSCFLQALQHDPLHFEAAEQLSEVLKAGEQRDLFPVATRYIERLKTINVLIAELANTRNVEMMLRIAEKFAAINQKSLATAWCQAAEKHGEPPFKKNALSDKLQISESDVVSFQQFKTEFEQYSNTNQSSDVDWGNLRFPDAFAISSDHQSLIRFDDITNRTWNRAEVSGVSATNVQLEHLFETTGCGVGVIDYDLDGWPDLYFAQSGDWKESKTKNERSNSLIRNLHGASAANISSKSGLESYEFSQGVCVGDYNSDGFDDIYVCQLFGNRLFENQGDGTFVDVTATTTVAGDDWSLSAGFADLNSDGLADLYVVNYLNRSDVAAELCRSKGRLRACPPKMFTGAIDHCFLNAGDGTFVDLSRSTGIAEHRGKGMGLVVADFDRNRSLEVFVGNDGEENFLFQNRHFDSGTLPRFEENALRFGLATDGDGLSQATMGVASGDLNADGFLDLFVTNFYRESNTYYKQMAEGEFTDATIDLGALKSESLEMLGFGVQLIDPDLDGDLDIVIANGHVDRSEVTGEPDRMKPQLFENLGNTQFRPLESIGIGNYFQIGAFGRGVAKIDWNRDGRDDLCFTHLDRIHSLLLNQTRSGNYSMSLQLISTQGERTAIGTTVTVRCGKKEWTQQLTSGDGYLVSNQRHLLFGLDNFETVDEIKVNWTSGTEQVFRDVPENRNIICIENRERLIPTH